MLFEEVLHVLFEVQLVLFGVQMVLFEVQLMLFEVQLVLFEVHHNSISSASASSHPAAADRWHQLQTDRNPPRHLRT